MLLFLLYMFTQLAAVHADNQPTELPQAGMLRHVLMTDAAGQRYNCSIPGTPSQFSSAIAAQQASQAAAVATRTPFELLDSLSERSLTCHKTCSVAAASGRLF